MPNLRVIFSGLCSFVTQKPLEEAESLVLILPDVSEDFMALGELVPGHTASLAVREKDLKSDQSSDGDLVFGDPKEPEGMKNLYLIRGSEVRFATDHCASNGLEIDLSSSETSLRNIARLSAKLKSRVLPDSLESPAEFETSVVAARSILTMGSIRVRELTVKPGEEEEPWRWTMGHPNRALDEYPYTRKYEWHRQLATSVEWVVPIKECCTIHLTSYLAKPPRRKIVLESQDGRDVVVDLSNRELQATLGLAMKVEPVVRDLDFYGFYKILDDSHRKEQNLVVPIAEPEPGAGGLETGKPCVQGLIEVEAPSEV